MLLIEAYGYGIKDYVHTHTHTKRSEHSVWFSSLVEEGYLQICQQLKRFLSCLWNCWVFTYDFNILFTYQRTNLKRVLTELTRLKQGSNFSPIRLPSSLFLSPFRFIEYGEYKGNYYGTSLDSIRSVLSKNKVCLMDVQPHVSACCLLPVSLSLQHLCPTYLRSRLPEDLGL